MDCLLVVESYNSPIVRIDSTSQLLSLDEAPEVLRNAILGRQEKEIFSLLIDGHLVEIEILQADGSSQAQAAVEKSCFLDDRWILPRTHFREQY